MRFYPVIITLLLMPFCPKAQTTISNVINTYYKVTQVIPANACVRLDNTTGLSRGDLVVIVQMKGALVATANTSSFGSVTSLNNAGNYEINTICSVEGDLVYMFRQFAQTYTSTDKVQLVKIPVFTATTVTVTDTLKAAPWDSATGKGGVLALSVTNNLVLNAPVYASGKGFKGGAYMTSNNTCFNIVPASNYVYNATILGPQEGAYKGESIADLSVTYSGGKGAAANGGGGGNNHNNGGGGGANIVAGGMGGGNSSATGCTVPNAGRNGYALSNNSGLKIYLGGGGGAGHANSGFFSTGGGAGGGIILVHANNLVSNGQKIMANGIDGGSTTGDGASGGGAGGTIILDVSNFADPVNIEAKGGNGGDENDDFTSQRCYGEGGGGSGGVVYTSGTAPSGINTNGGSNGNRLNSLNCAAIVAGSDGSNGSTVSNYSFVQSSILSGYCGVLLDIQIHEFRVRLNNHDALINWEVDGVKELEKLVLERKKDGEEWKAIFTVSSTAITQYIDKNLLDGKYNYRLRIVEKNIPDKFSQVKSISVSDEKISLYPNPATDFITVIFPFKNGSKLKIMNVQGEVVLEKQFHHEESFFRQKVSSFGKGVYYLVIADKNIRFVVN